MKMKFEELEKEIFECACDMARQITYAMLQELDSTLHQNRDKSRYKSKQLRRTTIKTVYGEVEYKRHQYFDETKKEYVYLLDKELQMEKIGTISTNLAKIIARTTIDMPFRKAADNISMTTGQNISSHGVWNVTQKIGSMIQEEEEELLDELKKEDTRGNEECKVLFQEADGVYINIQENKQKAKSQEIKLSTIYNGWTKENKLNNKIVYAALESAKKFNEKTEALIQSVYNIDETDIRILNGDGAAWIKNTSADVVYQLDRFHILKEIRKCIPDKGICRMIIDKFKNNKIDDMLQDIETYINSIDDCSNSNKVKLAKGLLKYLANNYTGLRPWQVQLGDVPEAPEGITYKNMGVQENQNCSLVTMRMKGRKMRWSVQGANNLVKLIYTRENGNLNKIIDERDGEINIPEEISIKDVVSPAQIKTKIGKGSRYAEIYNAALPLLSHSTGAYTKCLRKIAD